MSTTLREFYHVHGDAPDELVRGQQRAHGLDAAGPSQVQRPPSTSPGFRGREQGGRAPSSNTRDAMSSRSVGQEGHVQSWRRCLGWSLKLASQPCTSICGLTT
jgi:hypothetical protein